MNICTGCNPSFLVNKDVYVNTPSGVEDISADNVPVEWYTLQGVRIFGEPEKGRVYIRRQGSKVEKVRYL